MREKKEKLLKEKSVKSIAVIRAPVTVATIQS